MENINKLKSCEDKISQSINNIIVSGICFMSILYWLNTVEYLHRYAIWLALPLLAFCVNIFHLYDTLTDIENTEIPKASNGEIIKEIESFIGIRKELKNRNLFNYIGHFVVEHPYYTLSFVGLFLTEIYFPHITMNMRMLFSQIPLIGNIYSLSYTRWSILFLFLLTEYVFYITNPTLRTIAKTFIYFLFPVIIASFLSGILFFLIVPFNVTFYTIKHGLNYIETFAVVIEWFGNGNNYLNSIITMAIAFILLKSGIINSIKKDIGKLEAML